MKPLEEHLGIGPEASVRVATRRSRYFHFEWHFHDEVELTLIQQGSGRRYIGDSVEEYRDGDFVLIGPTLPHTWESNLESGSMQEAVVALFSVESLGQWPEVGRLKQLIRRSARGVQFGGAGAKVAAHRFLTVSRRSGLRQVLGLIELLHFLTVSKSVHRKSIASPGYEVPSTAADERTQRVLLYLSEHFADPLTQAEIGKLIDMSPSSFARFFRHATGKTFSQYMRQIRIAAACRQLTETGEKITDIAYANGFNNLAHFNRTFHLLKKMTPSAYRAAYRRKESWRES